MKNSLIFRMNPAECTGKRVLFPVITDTFKAIPYTAFLILFVSVSFHFTMAQNFEPESSPRKAINLGITPWKFTKGDPSGADAVSFDDVSWEDVGVPHCWNDDDSYTNMTSGGGDMYTGIGWYRKHFTLDASYSENKVFIEFGGANIAAQVYINGTFIEGNSELNPDATHVIGFVPFIVDVTPYVNFGEENVLAVRVSNGGGFYESPGFATAFRFGQRDGGLFRPVWMHITDKVYIPVNVYSVVEKWGTCVGTVSASDATATIRAMTNVYNESGGSKEVTLTTKVVDASNVVALAMEDTHTIESGTSYVFDQNGDIANPQLWYPANSVHGSPDMYKVYHIVQTDGQTVDVFESPLGIREIAWDNDFPYINGNQHYLWGMSGRYNYPALGSAVPDELLWKDAALTAGCGGRAWRPGHSTCAHEFVEACDAFGVMLVQPSGEGEGAFSTTAITESKKILKRELHRDMIVRDRNHPSILSWEVSNAGIDPDFAAELKILAAQWDPVYQRPQSDRGYLEACRAGVSDLISCSLTGCEIGQKYNPDCVDYPAFGAEGWGTRSSRYAWDYELEFAGEYIQNWKNSKKADCFGLAHWYLAAAPGETGEFLGHSETARSFGSSAMDFSRIPKLLYHMYDVCWTPYEIEPNVVLAHHWNRSGNVRVNAFSNCPSVRLMLNGSDLGEKTPNPWDIAGNQKDQNTTELPYQCWWDNVAWEAGTLIAQGLDESGNIVCADTNITAGSPHHIELIVEPRLERPDGSVFRITANGTDAATILAKVVDSEGVWCPEADQNITFSVSGPCEYRGGSDQFVTDGQPQSYHSPGDPELKAEGGMCKIAVRSEFTPGEVTVTATADGLGQGQTSYTIYEAEGGSTSVNDYPQRAGHISLLKTRLVFHSGVLKYYVSRTSNVNIQIFDAAGRILNEITGRGRGPGWHRISMKDDTRKGAHYSNGVYFVRLSVDGKNMDVKRIVMFE